MTSRAEKEAVRIGHMLDAISGLRQVVAEAGLEGLDSSWTRMRAFERGFEIISEASRHVSEDTKATEPGIAWREIAGIGNVLRHDYDGLQAAILTNAFENRIDDLEAALRRMLARLQA